MAGKYQAYPEYKDTETDWLGAIPQHWQMVAIGRLFRRLKRTGYSEEELLSVYRDYGVIPKSSRDDNNNKPSEDLTPYQLVERNDLVMNKMKTWQGSIAISEYRGIVSPAYFVYQPLPNLFRHARPRYIHYLLRNPIHIAQFLRRSKGIRVSQWDLDPDEFQRIELLLPEINEQAAIVNFLDHETAKTDILIAKQQQLIALLKEKRQAVISHAVTKGLNPDAPMKDSGVEWLGEVPAHWHIAFLRRYTESIRDGTHNPPPRAEGIYRLLSVRNIINGEFCLRDDDRTLTEAAYHDLQKSYTVVRGDVMLAIVGGTTGKSAVAGDLENVTVQRSLAIIRMRKEKCSPYYLNYFLQTPYIQNTIKQVADKYSAQPGIYLEDVGSLKVLSPSLNEQEQICRFLDNRTKVLDIVIEKAELQINYLQERRTALISAAVTGKIDVRNWQPPTKITTDKEPL